MSKKRSIAGLLGVALAAGLVPHVHAQFAQQAMKVYKSPTCGCCTEWEKHMRANGFRVVSNSVADMGAVKRSHGIPQALSSCHTARIGDYVLEGHVPAQDVKRLLAERPKAQGISVPGMPMGAPGMEQGSSAPYTTVAFTKNDSWTFERH